MVLKNIMSVDLEDYFCDLPFSEWSKYPSRVEKTTDVLLELFEEFGVKATFFTLGYIGEKFPNLIKKIYDKGHEIGSHSYSHIDLRKVSKDEAERDIVKSIEVLEKITGEKLLGFRAPYFSINHNNFWIFDVLRKYFKYDSSVFPVKTPLYGLPDALTQIYHPTKNDITKNNENKEFIEIPPLTYQFLNYNFPVAGGFYFRFFPYFFIKKGFTKFAKKNEIAMFYIHPKDLDPNMPKVAGYSWHYYYGKGNILEKFQRLLIEFKFGTAKEVLGL